MPYFQDTSLTLDLMNMAAQGMREAQIGAITGIVSHFTLRSDPALVVMPTGAGKTLVLILSAFLFRAERVLVLAPSTQLRKQILEDFVGLRPLRKAGLLTHATRAPLVHEVKHEMSSEDAWRELTGCDVAVALPNCVSPSHPGIVAPPAGLFDLILVDEAHHSPAQTWDAVLRQFSSTRRLLFTATPFRRDRKEIEGHLVYNYPLSRARQANIFGGIRFRPVEVDEDSEESADLAIAHAAVDVFLDDREQGFDHNLLVRTNGKGRADELLTLYQEHTALKLEKVDSSRSSSDISRIVQELKGGQLDGIVCVDMLGEGFDCPSLKIAALHTPHKSLGVTLQFIGRFARIGDRTSTATFLAVPQEIKGETQELFGPNSSWEDIIINLSEARIGVEVAIRETLDRFMAPDIVALDAREISLYSLSPYSHVKVFRVTGTVNLDTVPRFPRDVEVIYRRRNPDQDAVVYITRQRERQRWTTMDYLASVTHDLFVIYYDRETQLLFINASARTNETYSLTAQAVTSGITRGLPLSRLRRVLANMSNLDFTTIGMRRMAFDDEIETYRSIAGAGVQRAVQESDGEAFGQGHAFCTGLDGDTPTSIGYSAGSRIWSNQSHSLAQLLGWCRLIARRISNTTAVLPATPLDHLSCGQAVERIPEGPIGIDWNPEVWLAWPQLEYRSEEGETRVISLPDLDLSLDREHCTADRLRVRLSWGTRQLSLDFCFETHDFYTPTVEGDWSDLRIIGGRYQCELLHYIREWPLSFYFADFSRLENDEWYCPTDSVTPPLDRSLLETVRWTDEGVDIRTEIGTCPDGRLSIHGYLEKRLARASCNVVYYDHIQGEVADFITMEDSGERIKISLYHCKKSGAATAGQRVEDIYEVTCQAIKSLNRLLKKGALVKHIERRSQGRQERFRKGSLSLTRALLERTAQTRTEYEIVIVQPGIPAFDVDPESERVLASAAEYIRKFRSARLRIMASP